MKPDLPSNFVAEASRFVRFCAVGGSGVFVDMAVFYLLVDPSMLGWDMSLGKLVAGEVAILNNFAWNEGWTFRDRAAGRMNLRERCGRLAKFNLICLIGIALCVMLLNAQVRLLHVNPYLANLIAILIVTFWNFFMNLAFSWDSAGMVRK